VGLFQSYKAATTNTHVRAFVTCSNLLPHRGGILSSLFTCANLLILTVERERMLTIGHRERDTDGMPNQWCREEDGLRILDDLVDRIADILTLRADAQLHGDVAARVDAEVHAHQDLLVPHKGARQEDCVRA